MKKIIEHGRLESQVRRFACRTCSCVFDATPDDYETVITPVETCYHAMCPECGCLALAYKLYVKE